MRILSIDPGSTHFGWAVASYLPSFRARYIDGGKGEVSVTAILELIDRFEPNAVAVESVVHYGARDPKMAARSGHLVKTASAAGMFAGVAEMRGLRVVTMPASEWRHRFVGKRGASDAMIKRACAMMVDGLPVRTNEHVRDALGLAVVVLRRLVTETRKGAA